MNNKKIIAFMLSLAMLCPTGNIPMGEIANCITASADTVTGSYQNITWSYDTETKILTISGTGAIPSNFAGSYLNSDICTDMNKVTIKNGITSIGQNAFYSCKALTSINIPENVTPITNETFSCCKKLTSINIPESVISIGANAFYYCKELTSITIPKMVTSIDNSAFWLCESLASLTVDEDNPNYCSENDILFNKDKTKLILYSAKKTDTSYLIPESVTSIGDFAFCCCTSLTNIIIPETVTSIGNKAFYECSSLKSIDIPKSISSISYGMFSDCTNLTEINIPESINYIGSNAFYNCTSLTSIKIPETVTYIGSWAFGSCSSLVSINIPANITTIYEYTFRSCSALKNITIPASVTSIKQGVFYNCPFLKSVVMLGMDEISIDSSAFSTRNYIYGFKDSNVKTSVESNELTFIPMNGTCDNDRVNWVYAPETKTLTITGDGTIPDDFYNDLHTIIQSNVENLIIENGITSIGTDAFSSCSSLASITLDENNANYCTDNGILFSKDKKTLVLYPAKKEGTTYEIPTSVTSIDSYAFCGCQLLTSITIPNGVISIGDNAFYNCTSLTSLTFPSSVTSIGTSTYDGCSKLTTLNVDKLKSECDEFNLSNNDGKITINYAHSVTYNLTNIQSSNESTRVSVNSDYTTILSLKEDAPNGYHLSESITIKVGSSTLNEGENKDYTYNKSTGELIIKNNKITDNIIIEATATLNEYKVTSNLTNIDFDGANVVNHGKEYRATLSINEGYTLTEDIIIKVGNTLLTDGYTFVDGVLTIEAEKVTGDISIEATATLNEYKVTSNLANITFDGANVVNHGKEYKATLSINEGYTLTKDIIIKVGNTLLTDGYTFVDGVLTIEAEKVTGDISIEAIATLNEYKVISNLTNIDFEQADFINYGEEYQITLKANAGYNLPNDVTIKIGDTILTDGYTYDKTTGKLTINAEKVTGNITIEATADLIEYTTSNEIIGTSNEKIKGDATLDGKIMVNDLLLIKKHVLKVSELTGQSLLNGDINDDNKVMVNDLLWVKKYVLKIINNFDNI